ncbi:hypothetical protein TWF106_005122 [Orbilia oligospora]|uniref:Uncharacterized protein n=1 Tax=Orbilia oligospora TaxID=2813651 RepID=A0A6G1MCS3_ORBOL|nr:hypothetical protein TWF191_008768 [Orbilia oligospora]KAF3222458.1 hypothetical protein TWF679_005937 [Orbilia oligospora]KAF3223349.1 hypothetical protein TWF106_005122 [Orbilia oligospora]KAF3253578.1 hypothetical protein TWF192_003831 [Orbilia oligospora]
MPHSSQPISANCYYSQLQPLSHGFALKSYIGQPQSLPNICPSLQTISKPDQQRNLTALSLSSRFTPSMTTAAKTSSRPTDTCISTSFSALQTTQSKISWSRSKSRGSGDCPLLFHEDCEPEPPNMLSNLRFNIFTRFYDDFMYIELAPRPSRGVPLKYIKEASFTFGLMELLNWTEEHATWDDGVRVDMGPE